MESSAGLLSMKGRRVLITGASSGIGRAMAGVFSEAGADLVLVDIDEGGLARTAAALGRDSLEVRTRATDLSDKEQIDALWRGLGDAVPDTLVNNAGVYRFRDFLRVNPAFLRTTLRVNLDSMFWMCQGFIRKGRGRGGVIINVSSIEAIMPFTSGMVHYSVSKAGVLALTRALARDYGREGFRVNALVPGAIRTRGTSRLARMAIKGVRLGLMRTGLDFQRRLALGRWGRPDEVASVALFLASDLASYVHGAIIPVDGGFLSS